jgi:hypothetical protein
MSLSIVFPFARGILQTRAFLDKAKLPEVAPGNYLEVFLTVKDNSVLRILVDKNEKRAQLTCPLSSNLYNRRKFGREEKNYITFTVSGA